MLESFLKGVRGKLLYLKKFPPEDFLIKAPSQACPGPRSARTWLLPAVVVAATVAIYASNFGEVFVNWDYSAYREVLNRTDYLKLAKELLTDFHGKIVTGDHAPVSSISLMLDKYLLGSGEPPAMADPPD